MKPIKLFGLDLETSQLNPVGGHILEVGIVDVGTWEDFCKQTYKKALQDDRKGWKCDQVYHALNPWSSPNTWHPECIKMHEASGLTKDLDACRATGARHDLSAPNTHVARSALNWIASRTPAGHNAHLVGHSVHFDLHWLREHAGADYANRALHYRVLDVSSLQLAEQFRSGTAPLKNAAHRALDDVEASLDALWQMIAAKAP